ncbi:MAG: hypothetical protein M1839_003412 [Geoglossum umbratile]|nr:MAG: hypothetical protein M1839_003412 [Geoglossum umbratile]
MSAHSCVDVQHKKRGRPRLRDGHGPRFEAFETAVLNPQSSLGPPLGSPIPSSAAVPPSYRPGSHRVLKSQTGPQPAVPRHLERASLRDANVVPPNPHGSTGFQPSALERRPYPSTLAVAYLSMDLIIAKTSGFFVDAVSPGVQDLVGRNLFDMIRTVDREKLYRLKCQMLEERDAREPAYLPPIYGESEIHAIQSVHESEIASITLGSHDRTEDLTFRLPDGRYSRFQVQLKLAKTSVFFAILVLPTSSYQPGFQPPLPQTSQYRQAMIPSTYGQTTPLPSYSQPPQTQSFPSVPPPYYNERNLSPGGPLSGDRRSQVQSDPGYHQMVQYSSAPPAPSHLAKPSATPASSAALQKPQILYAGPSEGPPRRLQLPPLRGVTGPGDAQTVEAKVERDAGRDGQREQQEGGRIYRRDRIAVQEMLE